MLKNFLNEKNEKSNKFFFQALILSIKSSIVIFKCLIDFINLFEYFMKQKIKIAYVFYAKKIYKKFIKITKLIIIFFSFGILFE